MDRARTEGALNHLGLFAFNWTRPRTNLSPKSSAYVVVLGSCVFFVGRCLQWWA